jgi:hypothetical protein
MQRRRFDFRLAITTVVALALLGVAVWFAILRPNDNYQGYIFAHVMLPDNPIPDCWISVFFLLFTALACFAGGVHYDEDDGKSEEGDGGLSRSGTIRRHLFRAAKSCALSGVILFLLYFLW